MEFKKKVWQNGNLDLPIETNIADNAAVTADDMNRIETGISEAATGVNGSYTKTEVDSKLNAKQNVADSYTKTQTNSAISEGLKKIYPIGSVYINATSDVNPSELIGFGTWVEFGNGYTLVGQDSGTFKTLGSKIGSETHKLTEKELPVLEGKIGRHGAGIGAASRYRDANGVFSKSEIVQSISASQSISENYSSVSIINFNAGQGNSHNNIQPSIVVKMWVRTA